MAIICPDYKLLFIMVPGTGCSVVGRVLEQEFGGMWFPEKPLREAGKVVVSRKHNTLEQILQHGLLTPEERERYLVFATVRNPFDRFVTYYQRLAGEWTEYYLGFAERDLERRRDTMTPDQYQEGLVSLTRRTRKLRRKQRIIRAIGFNAWLSATLLRWTAQDRRRPPAVKTQRALEHLYPMLEGVDVAMRYEQLEPAVNAVLGLAGVQQPVALPRKNVTHGKKPYTAYYRGMSRRLMETLYQEELDRFAYGFEPRMFDHPLVQLTALTPFGTAA